MLGYDFNGPVLEFLPDKGAEINSQRVEFVLKRENYKAIAAMLVHQSILHGLNSAKNLYTKAQQGCGKNIKQEDIIEAFTQKIEEYSSDGKKDLANVCKTLKNELFKPTRLDEVDVQSLNHDINMETSL